MRLTPLPDPLEDGKHRINSAIVNRRGIYKDVYGSGREWSDYQFRPNFPIAMTVAPEVFDNAHALGALRLADQVLRGPLGMKTLDPKDLQYRPVYDNANDSSDPTIAKGLNYHNVGGFLSFPDIKLTEPLLIGTRVGMAAGLLLEGIPALFDPQRSKRGLFITTSPLEMVLMVFHREGNRVGAAPPSPDLTWTPTPHRERQLGRTA